ncbi:MAG TPA: YDG domain-containing protein [Gaiellaceae bacterium]|nr:YDG domain-containing protein [Gaiellaceae bacterium]
MTFTATVTADGGSPDGVGSVTFRNGATALCSAVALSGNTATCTASGLSAAASPHAVTAEYSGTAGGSPQFEPSTSATLSQAVHPKPVDGSFTAADKVYDGTADAEITGRALTGAIAGDDVSLSGGTASFDDENAGEDKPVSGTGFALAGADKDNYALGSVAGTTATIEPRELAVAASGLDKVYDGTAAASTTFTDDRIPGDSLTIDYDASFADKHVGDDKPVSVTGISLAGPDAGNYALTSTTAATTADITPRALVVTATGVDKVYDGTTAATVTLADDRVSGDELDVSYATAAFADAGAGTGKVIDVGGISVTGADAGNYTHNTSAVATADIAPRPITVTAEPKSKPFGAPDPAFTYAVSGGPLVAGDGFSGSLTRVAGEAVGGYDILQGTVSAGPNYAIAYVGATLTIGAWHAVGFHQPIGTGNSQFVPAPGLAPHVGTAVWNTAKGGSTIPLKFDLFTAAGGDERTSTADVKGFQAVRLTGCASGGGEEAVEFVTTGTTSLRYDGTAGQFVQNWRSPSVSGEECYRVSVRFQDESAVYAFVKLRR